MKEFQVVTLEHVVGILNIFISAFDNYDTIIKTEHVEKTNNNAIMGSLGLSNREVDTNGLDDFLGIVSSP